MYACVHTRIYVSHISCVFPVFLLSVCEDSPSYWQDSEGRSCDDYVSGQLCTSDGQHGPNWSQFWGSFADFAMHGIAAPQACCGCGKEGCIADVVLVVDRSGSIGTYNWQKMVAYMKDRVTRTRFTTDSGNRLGIVAYSSTSELVCPMLSNKGALLACIDEIAYNGGLTNTAHAIGDAGEQLDLLSSSSRIRLIEGVLFDRGTTYGRCCRDM